MLVILWQTLLICTKNKICFATEVMTLCSDYEERSLLEGFFQKLLRAYARRILLTIIIIYFTVVHPGLLGDGARIRNL